MRQLVQTSISTMDVQKFHKFSEDYMYPLLSSALTAYSNSRQHPFEVQMVAGWITRSVFCESEAKKLKGILAIALASVYLGTFRKDLQKMEMLKLMDPTRMFTFLECLNTAGSYYLGACWLDYLLLSNVPSLRQYAREIKAGSGVMYILLALFFYKRGRR